MTGVQTCALPIFILVDARKGVLEQSRRHAFLSSLLGIRHLVVCVNKMDLVDWSRERFEDIRREFLDFARRTIRVIIEFWNCSSAAGALSPCRVTMSS